jgi:hypothetical protein
LTRSELITELATSNPQLRQADVELIVTTIFDRITTARARGANQPPPPPSGTVTMHTFQGALLVSGSGGDGSLNFQGRSYPFSIGVGGLGGVGTSTIDATGEVYSLNNVSQFPGNYVQGRIGFAIGDASAGDLWLKTTLAS